MASYSKTKSKHWTLTGNQVDDLTLTGYYRWVELYNRTPDTEVFYTYGNSSSVPADPTVDGDNTDVVAGGSSVRFEVKQANTVLKVKSTGTPKVSVSGSSV